MVSETIEIKNAVKENKCSDGHKEISGEEEVGAISKIKIHTVATTEMQHNYNLKYY